MRLTEAEGEMGGGWIPILFMLGCCPGGDVTAEPNDATVVAFVNVNVIPMDVERVLRGQTVIVRDGVIRDVGPSGSVDVPDHALRVDGAGRYLVPGLADMHIHLRSTSELLSYMAWGVTTVVHLSGAMDGAPDLLRYREELARGERLGPTLYASGPILDGEPPIFAGVSVVVRTPAEARRVVSEQQRAGYDFIKVYNNLTPDVLTAVTAAAHERGMAVIGHIPRKAGRERALQGALAAGLDLIAHGEEYFFTYFHGQVDSLLDQGRVPYPDEGRIPEAVRMTLEAGAAVTANLSFVAMTRRQLDDLDAVLSDPEARHLEPGVREMWLDQNPTRRPDVQRFDRRERAKYAFLKTLTLALHDAGVPLLLGTDASAPGMFPGLSAHLELAELVDAGLTPFEALATGTRNAGAFIGTHVAVAEPFGVIAPGQRADLVLLRENPLDDIRNMSEIVGVMVRGRWLPRSEIRRQPVSR
ncbi:MAG: amidohydrolase family protein [Longimicrobiales bacterium]